MIENIISLFIGTESSSSLSELQTKSDESNSASMLTFVLSLVGLKSFLTSLYQNCVEELAQ